MIDFRRRTIRVRVVFVVLACFVPLALPAATIEAKSARVVEVTVYPGRAEVVREASFEVPAGASTVEFRDIPVVAEPDSLRVAAKRVPAARKKRCRARLHGPLPEGPLRAGPGVIRALTRRS